MDTEQFGIQLESPTISKVKLGTKAFADVRALSAFLFRNDSTAQISRELTTNGPIRATELEAYVSVIERMRTEVRNWISSKANPLIQANAGTATPVT